MECDIYIYSETSIIEWADLKYINLHMTLQKFMTLVFLFFANIVQPITHTLSLKKQRISKSKFKLYRTLKTCSTFYPRLISIGMGEGRNV